MSEKKIITLSDISCVNPSKKMMPEIPPENLVGFLPMESVSNAGYIKHIEQRKISEIKSGFTYFEDGDILFAKITPCMENGKGALVSKMPNGIGFGSTEFHVIRPDTNKLDNKYLFYYTINPSFRKTAEKNMTGSAGQKRVPASFLKSAIIPLPPLDEQRRIAESLDLASSLIEKRKKQIELLDLLAKSLFVEMFGDPVENPMGWDVVRIEDVCEKITDGTHQTPKYSESGYVFLSSKNVKFGVIDWNNIKYIPEYLHNQLYKRLTPQRNDILLAKNGTTGVAALVDRDCIFDIYVSLALLRPISVINPIYLLHSINSDACKYQFNKSLKGIGVPNLHLNSIKKVSIFMPPLLPQNKFARRVKSIETQKSLLLSGLEKLEMNSKALMQKYFEET